MFCKIFIYVHKNLFAPQTWELLEKLALIFLYNFHREHGLINLIRKKLSPKINVKNIKHQVFFFLFFLVTVFFITIVNMVIIELYKPRATHMKYIEGNEEFSKSKTTKLFYFTRYSRLIFQS